MRPSDQAPGHARPRPAQPREKIHEHTMLVDVPIVFALQVVVCLCQHDHTNVMNAYGFDKNDERDKDNNIQKQVYKNATNEDGLKQIHGP